MRITLTVLSLIGAAHASHSHFDHQQKSAVQEGDPSMTAPIVKSPTQHDVQPKDNELPATADDSEPTVAPVPATTADDMYNSIAQVQNSIAQMYNSTTPMQNSTAPVYNSTTPVDSGYESGQSGMTVYPPSDSEDDDNIQLCGDLTAEQDLSAYACVTIYKSSEADAPVKTDCANYTEAMYNLCYYDEECPTEDEFCYGEEYDRQWADSSDDSDFESGYDASAVADAPVKTDCANYTEAMYNECYYYEDCPTEDEFCYGEADEQ